MGEEGEAPLPRRLAQTLRRHPTTPAGCTDHVPESPPQAQSSWGNARHLEARLVASPPYR
jgi:hypothetical protein